MSADNSSQDMIVSVGGKKVSLTPDSEMLSTLAGNLPPDAAALLAIMQSATAQIDIRNISSTSPGLKLEVQKEIASPETSQELVRSVPEEIRQINEKRKILEEINTSDDRSVKMIIHESGIALGIVIGTSTKKEVDQIIKDFSNVVCDIDNEPMFFYSDIGLTVFYNDEMIVRELQFASKYRGYTSKGLNIGDSLEKAIEIYGQPRMKTPKGAIWNRFGVFCQNNAVSSIRLMS